MKLKNITGKIFMGIVGAIFIIMVAYPHAMEYFMLTEKEAGELTTKDYFFLACGFFFMWGSVKFVTLANKIISLLDKIKISK